MIKKVWLCGLSALFLFAVGITVMAQSPTGSIEGTITDQNGAVVAGATVTITEKNTGRTVTLTTNSAGTFEARALLPGQYNVKIEQAGFGTSTQNNVTVLVGQVANVSTSLKVGSAAAVIDVTATAGDIQVDTSRQTVDGVIRAKDIDQLPLNGRNFLELARLEPGTVVRDGGAIDPTKVNAFRVVGVNGRSGTATRVSTDGIDVTDETVGTTVANLSDDAVSEFQLSRSSLDMSTSLTSSGAVNVVTRSGGNQLNGSAFFFGRNQGMAAKQGVTQTGPNDPFHRYQVGFRAGGKIIPDKLFWFANWEALYQQNNSRTDASDVPFFPQMAGSQGLPVYIRNTTGRLDWNVSNSMRAFFRFGNSADNSSGGSIQSPFQNIDWTNVSIAGVDWNKGNLSHSVRFGIVNFNNNIASQQFGGFPFPKTPDGTPYFLGVGQYQQGPNGLAPQQTFQDNHELRYDGSYTKGNHTLRFGADFNHIVLGGFANFAGPLTVSGVFTSEPKSPSNNNLGGEREQVIDAGLDPNNPLNYKLDSFTLGPQNGFFTIPAAHGFAHGGNYNNRFAFYVGDNWKARRNLTINIGTRWEYDSGYFNDEAGDGVKRPALLGTGYPSALTAPKFPKNLFGPSFGFAYDPKSDGKMVVRGGIYMAYEMNIFNNTIFNEFALIPPGIGPDSYDFSHVTGPDGTPINVDGLHPTGDYSGLAGSRIKDVLATIGKVNAALQAAYANYKFNPSGGTTTFEILQGNTFGGTFPGNYKIPYSLQFNIGFQRELWRGNVLSVDYVRNHGVGVPLLLYDAELRRDASTFNKAAAQTKVNSVLNGLTVDQWIAANPTKTISSFSLGADTIFTGLSSQLLRNRIAVGGFSLYQALQAKLQGRLANKLWVAKNMTYIVSYAYGSSQNTCGIGRGEFEAGACQNRNVLDKTYFGPNGFDIRHNFSAGVVLDTPGGFRFSQFWAFATNAPFNINVPTIGGLTSTNAIFSTDLNGDGGTGAGAPRGDVLPGMTLGQFGRSVHNIRDLNSLITNFNQNQAGKLTPAGQALLASGLFTQAQLVQLKAVVPTIPLIPLDNPNPFASKPFNLDLRISRPIKIEDMPLIHKNFEIEPSFDAFNLFNYRGTSAYPSMSLSGGFGSLNFNYAASKTPGQTLADLRAQRAFLFTTPRTLQFGVRVTFGH